MALAADKQVPFMAGEVFSYPVAATTHIYAGSMVVLDSAGNAEPATLATGKMSVGIAQEEVNNTGAAAAKHVTVRVGVQKVAKNGAMTKTSIGDIVYLYDDEKVQTSATSASAAGRLVQVDADGGMWVDFFSPSNTVGTALLAASNLADVTSAAAARSSLGLDTGDSPTFTGVTATGAIKGATLESTGLATLNSASVTTTLAVTQTGKFTGALSGPAYESIGAIDVAVGTAPNVGGGTYQISADGKAATLPAIAAGNKGMRVTVQNIGTATATEVTVKVTGSDKLIGSVAAVTLTGSAGKGAVNTKATSTKGAYLTVQSDGTDTWWVVGGVGVWAAES